MKSVVNHKKVTHVIATAGVFALCWGCGSKSDDFTIVHSKVISKQEQPLNLEEKAFVDSFAEAQKRITAGDSLLESGKLAQAKAEYQKASEILPASNDAWYGIARVLDREGNSKEAMKAYKKFLTPSKSYVSSNATDPRSIVRYSELCRESGDLVEERWANRLIIENAGHTKKYLTTLWGSLDAPDGNDGALRCRAEVVTGLRFFNAAVGNKDVYKKALKHYEAAIAADPNDAVAYYFKGEALVLMDRSQEAREALMVAQSLKPQSDQLTADISDRLREVKRRIR